MCWHGWVSLVCQWCMCLTPVSVDTVSNECYNDWQWVELTLTNEWLSLMVNGCQYWLLTLMVLTLSHCHCCKCCQSIVLLYNDWLSLLSVSIISVCVNVQWMSVLTVMYTSDGWVSLMSVSVNWQCPRQWLTVLTIVTVINSVVSVKRVTVTYSVISVDSYWLTIG